MIPGSKFRKMAAPPALVTPMESTVKPTLHPRQKGMANIEMTVPDSTVAAAERSLTLTPILESVSADPTTSWSLLSPSGHISGSASNPWSGEVVENRNMSPPTITTLQPSVVPSEPMALPPNSRTGPSNLSSRNLNSDLLLSSASESVIHSRNLVGNVVKKQANRSLCPTQVQGTLAVTSSSFSTIEPLQPHPQFIPRSAAAGHNPPPTSLVESSGTIVSIPVAQQLPEATMVSRAPIQLITAQNQQVIVEPKMPQGHHNVIPFRIAPEQSEGLSFTPQPNTAIATLLPTASGVMTNCQILTEDVISLPPLGTPKMSLITLEDNAAAPNTDRSGSSIVIPPNPCNSTVIRVAEKPTMTVEPTVFESVKILPSAKGAASSEDSSRVVQRVKILPDNREPFQPRPPEPSLMDASATIPSSGTQTSVRILPLTLSNARNENSNIEQTEQSQQVTLVPGEPIHRPSVSSSAFVLSSIGPKPYVKSEDVVHILPEGRMNYSNKPQVRLIATTEQPPQVTIPEDNRSFLQLEKASDQRTIGPRGVVEVQEAPPLLETSPFSRDTSRVTNSNEVLLGQEAEVLSVDMDAGRLKNSSENDKNPLEDIDTRLTKKKSDVLIKYHCEEVTCFKCKKCGYLGLSKDDVSEHLELEHNIGLKNDLNDDSNYWLQVAQQQRIPLECPSCPNLFMAEGSRSFKVHMTDDHQASDNEARRLLDQCQSERKKKTLKYLQEQQEKMKEEKLARKSNKLEVYINDKGELRIRSARRVTKTEEIDVTGLDEDNVDDSDEEVDVSVKEYEAAVKSGKRDGNALTKIQPSKKRRTAVKLVTSADKGLDLSLKEKKRTPGRPKGSRTTGLWRLKRLNTQIKLNEEELVGMSCGASTCGVRFKEEKNLEYHRKCHPASNPEKYQCLECKEQPFVALHWKNLALHLWKKHRIDMELLSCDKCEHFRCYTNHRLQSHQVLHSDERPFLCNSCGKSFKMEKHLKVHANSVHETKETNEIKVPKTTPTTFECQICNRIFGNSKLLRIHTERVHKKLRPHLCNFCGYSASSSFDLQLHTRGHTGEKPYACPHCEFRTGDHNSFRRHKMRHTGEKKYKCIYCDYSAIQSTSYRSHMKKNHPEANLILRCPNDNCKFETLEEAKFGTHVKVCH